MRISDETLLAYVDGELDEMEKARVDAAARTDAALARRIQAQRRLRERMANVFADLVAEPPPERLAQAVTAKRPPAAVVDLNAVRQQRAKQQAQPKPSYGGWMRWGAAAACLMLALGVGYEVAPYLPSPGTGALVGGPPGTLMAQSQLATALDGRLASAGTKPGDMVRIGVSFRAAGGQYCRTFQVAGQIASRDGFAGLACRDPAGWRLRMVVADAAPAGDGPAYRKAASETPAPILSAVEGLIDGAPLDAQQEAAARAKGWRG